jgi:predicted HicB family RNase H-like nuclease
MVLKKLEKPKSLDEFIDGGGNVASDKEPEEKKEWSHFTLRIRKDLSADIDKVLEHRVGISKTGWILEAIQEKLRKENE